MFVCCKFRLGTLHFKMIVLNFPPVIAHTTATPLHCTTFPRTNIQIFKFILISSCSRDFSCLLVFPHCILSSGCYLLTKCIKHLGRKKKKTRKKKESEKRVCFRLQMLQQSLSFNLNYTQQSHGHWCSVSNTNDPICCA